MPDPGLIAELHPDFVPATIHERHAMLLLRSIEELRRTVAETSAEQVAEMRALRQELRQLRTTQPEEPKAKPKK